MREQEAIETLVLNGYTILQLIQPNGSVLYFNVFKWQESYFNTAQSVDYNTVDGVNITDFLTRSANVCGNVVDFINTFNKELEKSVVLHCEFSKETVFYKWSAATVKML